MFGQIKGTAMSVRQLGAIAGISLSVALLSFSILSPALAGATGAIGSDSFNRTVTNGWGTSDQGGSWTVLDDASMWSVAPGAGTINAAPNVQERGILGSTVVQDVDLLTTIVLPRCTAGGNCDAYEVGRYAGGTSPTYYRVGIVQGTGTGTVLLRSQRGDGTYLSGDLSTGVRSVDGVVVDLRVELQGINPTTIRARAWQDGTVEPATWLLTTTDSTSAMQTAGGVGVRVRNEDTAASHTFRYESFVATTLSNTTATPTPQVTTTLQSTATATVKSGSTSTTTPLPTNTPTATSTHSATNTPLPSATTTPLPSATNTPNATSTSTPAGGPDSAHLIRSVNDSLYDGSDQLANDTTTQGIVRQHNTPLIRMPFRDTITDAQDLQALNAIKNAGAAPLVIVHGACISDPYTPDVHWLSLVAQVFTSGPVYVEYGNEEDLSCPSGPSISATTYQASWNSVIPRLKAAYPTYKFIGPVNYQTNPTYIATFVTGANPQPDFISWHEYVCSSTDSDTTCNTHIANWATHVSSTNAAVVAAIGHTIPIMITEWNLDPFSDSRYSNSAFIQPWTTSALNEWSSLTSSGVYAAFLYTLESHSSFQLIDGSDNLTPQGAVFFL
jgi:hypothetical protein